MAAIERHWEESQQGGHLSAYRRIRVCESKEILPLGIAKCDIPTEGCVEPQSERWRTGGMPYQGSRKIQIKNPGII
jgi:hypothetical protein